jgi:hypothetical protein
MAAQAVRPSLASSRRTPRRMSAADCDLAVALGDRLEADLADDVHDRAAGQLVVAGDRLEVEGGVRGGPSARSRGSTGARARPGAAAGSRRRLEPAGERVVEVLAQVGGEDRDAVEGLDALQQVGDLLVGVAVVGVLALAALAEQGVGLVEEQDPAALLGPVEHAGEVLLGLADVLRDDEREVDAVDVAAGALAEQRGADRLAGARRAVEQGAVAGAQARGHAPVAHQRRAVVEEQLDSWSWRRCSGEDEVVPRPCAVSMRWAGNSAPRPAAGGRR